MGKVVCQLCLSGMSLQQAIKHMNGIIGRAKQEDKRWLRIEEYREYLGHPFSDGEVALRVVNVRPDDSILVKRSQSLLNNLTLDKPDAIRNK